MTRKLKLQAQAIFDDHNIEYDEKKKKLKEIFPNDDIYEEETEKTEQEIQPVIPIERTQKNTEENKPAVVSSENRKLFKSLFLKSTSS